MNQEDNSDHRLDKGLKAAFGGRGRRGVHDAVERLTDMTSRVLLRDDPEEHSPLLKIGASGEETIEGDSRYRIVGEIGRGGVGVVFKGRDGDLGRDVALKVLRSDLADHPEIVQRFVEEAQIEGQLQHPGIVPVYGLGLQPDGRPYFAMKLVKGRTLSALLSERKADEPELPTYLPIFEQVCQAVAYVHARGVIHRDLKPGTILVGAFGEVLVVDWGFAKVLDQGGDSSVDSPAPMTTVIATVRSGDGSSHSLAGSVMGTPAYMPPEQALGHVDSLDERSDVFSLGAILTEILTGAPAYTGEGLEKLVKAAEADLVDANARLDSCGQDPELVKLARACLAPLRPDRPAHAGMVARAVTAYLTGVEERARKSELRAAKARAKAEEARQTATQQKRARRQTLVLAVSVLLLIMIAAGGYGFLEHDRRTHLAGVVEEVRSGMRQATLLSGRDGPAAALSMARGAHDLARTEDVPADLLEEAGALVADLETEVQGLVVAEKQRVIDQAMLRTVETIRIDRGPSLGHVGYDDALLQVFAGYGIDVDGADFEGASRMLAASAIRERLTVVLDEWALMRRTKEPLADRDAHRLLALGRAVDDDPWRNRVRDCIGQGNLEGLRNLSEGLDPASQPPQSIDLLARLLLDQDDDAAAEVLLRRALHCYPGDYDLPCRAFLVEFRPTVPGPICRNSGRARPGEMNGAQRNGGGGRTRNPEGDAVG